MQFPKQENLYIYNKKHQRQKIKETSFYFFGSGSTGNSVYLKLSHLLIDLGFPYKKYMDLDETFFYNVRYILLTHEHTDHLNTSTLLRILDIYPHIKVFITKRMFDRITSVMFFKRFNKSKEKAQASQNLLKNKYYQRFIFIEDTGETYNLYKNDDNIPPVQIKPYLVTHEDIINVAYEIKTHGLKVLYSSDLDHVFAPKPKDSNEINETLNLPLEYDYAGNVKIFEHPFDLIFLEANYDADILKRFIEEHPEDAHAKGNMRHISEQESWKYLDYALADNGLFVPLHASQSFGTLVQDLS